jgi:sugar porter (SP) family MFS transporter
MNDIAGPTESIPPGRWQSVTLFSVIAAMGGLLFGYDWVVISGAKPFFIPYFKIHTPNLTGWVMSCALLGALLGAMTGGYAADRLGRKKMLFFSALLFAVSSVMTGWAGSVSAFVVWRIIGGVAIGIASNLSPLYIAEVSPAAWRGRLVAINQLTIVLGILIADVANWLIARPISAHASHAAIATSWDGQYGWRFMFTAVAVPSLVFLISVLWIPESPRWLAVKNRWTDARRVLSRLRGGDCDAEISAIRASLVISESGATLKQLFNRKLLWIIAVGIGLAVLQQWCGINVIFSYAQNVFNAAGYHVNGVLFEIVIMGAVNLIFTLAAMVFVDRLGRRKLMIIGVAGLTCIHLTLGWMFYSHMHGWIVVVFVMAAIACYAMTLAPITWVLISEIFPNQIRATAVSVAVSALWIADFLLTQSFPPLKARIGVAGAFWLYAGICFAGLIFILATVPETKGKSLEELEARFGTLPESVTSSPIPSPN